MNYEMIWLLMRWIMRLEAVFMLPALCISAYHGEVASVWAFALAGVLLVACSMICCRKPRRREFFAREGFVTVGLTWIAVSVFGALPFVFSGAIPSFVDALFETVSGFTTTGASILPAVEELPRGMLYWRSFTHFLGGMGVLVFVLAIIPLTDGTGGNSLYLLRAESTGPQVGKLMPRMRDTAFVLYAIYIALTLVQIALLLAGGMSAFDAVTTAFGTAGTGGFGIKNDSMASYSTYLQIVVGVFMMLFGINFNVYFLLLRKQWKRALAGEEFKVYLGIMAAAVLGIALNLTTAQGVGFGSALHQAGFQVSSVMTTTGFSTVDFDLWPIFSKAILLVLMVLGACAGSTGGGIKIARLLILVKSARHNTEKMVHPRKVSRVRLDGTAVDEETVSGVYGYMAVYAVLLVVSILLVSLDGMDFETTVSAIFATINNIGPGFGGVGPTASFAGFSAFSKIVMSLDMLIGRLEIFPVLLLFVPSVWRKSRR